MAQSIRARAGPAMARSRYACGMTKMFASMLILSMIAACSTAPQVVRVQSACDISETSYECQVERYNSVNQ